MRQQNIKIIFILFILFLLDIARPFSYTIYAELLFVGIVIASLRYEMPFSFILCAFFGYLKDSFSLNPMPLATLEYALLSICTRGLYSRFKLSHAKHLIAPGAIIVHILLPYLLTTNINYIWVMLSFIHYSILYLIIHLLIPWTSSSVDSI